MAAAVAAVVAESECAECGCVLEEAASSGHQGHNRSSRCPNHNPSTPSRGRRRRKSHPRRTGRSRCRGQLRAAATAVAAECGCAENGCAESGCAACGCAVRGCATTTEARNRSSRCRDCTKKTRLLVRRRRSHRQRRRCTCLSIVPKWESGCAECGCAECADGGCAECGCAESADGGCVAWWWGCTVDTLNRRSKPITWPMGNQRGLHKRSRTIRCQY